MKEPTEKEVLDYLKKRGIHAESDTVYNWDLKKDGTLTIWIDGTLELKGFQKEASQK